MVRVTFDQAAVARLTDLIKDSGANIKREIAIAINGTSKQCSIASARLLKFEIKVPVKILKKAVRPGIKANAKNLSTTVTLGKGHPIPLKYFLGKVKMVSPSEIERARPKYTKKQRATIGKGFVVNKYKDHVFQRATKKRGPLVRQNGPAPGEAFEKAGIAEITEQIARRELPARVEERIRFWKLKLAGQLRGNQK
jgi:hypothetical protein